MLTVCEDGDFLIRECLLSCIVLRCRNLPKMDVIGTCDPYVILELLPYSFYYKNQKEKRTPVQRGTLDPEYNEPFQW